MSGKKKQVGELSGTREPGRAPSGQRGREREGKRVSLMKVTEQKLKI